ncbi:hypothetical protein ABF162_24695 [Vibrio coralliilyticus]|uniref:hypothetical protein n=1 Tax=Vibrio coralliilyticus TaxID=190893 RepID=UPI0005128D14|nr:hypothetical protein [Vibrio coralliilyticus]AIS56981.1 hypothetical protein JV59_18200 [Vibrio coralliilyticus]
MEVRAELQKPLSLVLHHKLLHSRVIEMDYEMIKDELKLEVRAVHAGYLLRQWNVIALLKPV